MSASYCNKENINAKENVGYTPNGDADEPKLFKSKSDYMSFTNYIKNCQTTQNAEKSPSVKDLNLIKIESMVDLTNDEFLMDPASSSVCAFSTRNLFMPSSSTNNKSVKDNSTTKDENSGVPALALNTFPKKRMVQTFLDQIKQEFKPHVFKMMQQKQKPEVPGRLDENPNVCGDFIKIKKIIKPTNFEQTVETRPEINLISKSEVHIENMQQYSFKPEQCKSDLVSKSSYYIVKDSKEEKNLYDNYGEKRFLNKITEERETNQSENIGVSKIMNSKTQIPSKYSSFIDLTKNKSKFNNKDPQKPCVAQDINKKIPNEDKGEPKPLVQNSKKAVDENNININSSKILPESSDMSYLNQFKEVNVDDYFNSIMDYNSFNLKSYQLNSLNELYLNDNLAYQDVNYIGTGDFTAVNLGGVRSDATSSTTTTSSVSTNSTNSSAFASSSGINVLLGPTKDINV